jgi:hypothetical protein
MLAIPLAEAPVERPPRSHPVLIPEGFLLTEAESRKINRLARMLNCTAKTAANVLVYLMRYIQDHPRGLAVAAVPEVLVEFPVKWGYKKKRNDFLKLLIDLEFIYVKANYWAKIRAKRYALAPSGQELIDRLGGSQAPPEMPTMPPALVYAGPEQVMPI